METYNCLHCRSKLMTSKLNTWWVILVKRERSLSPRSTDYSQVASNQLIGVSTFLRLVEYLMTFPGSFCALFVWKGHLFAESICLINRTWDVTLWKNINYIDTATSRWQDVSSCLQHNSTKNCNRTYWRLFCLYTFDNSEDHDFYYGNVYTKLLGHSFHAGLLSDA